MNKTDRLSGYSGDQRSRCTDYRHYRYRVFINGGIFSAADQLHYRGSRDLTHRDGFYRASLQWVLSWGAGVIVLEPELFRNKIREEALKISERY